jgi:rhodanese-related sulfurtransferase
MSPTGRPEGEYRSAQHEGSPMSPTGRPEGEYRSAQHEGSPMSRYPASIPPGISPQELQKLRRGFPPPIVIDVRRVSDFADDPVVIPGAIRQLPETVAAWSRDLEPWRRIVACCAHGHDVSQQVAATLRGMGYAAQFLGGGLAGWRAANGATAAHVAPTRWVTRERPKIDRIACPWLIRRFIDPAAEFFYVPNGQVHAFARSEGATPYDVPDVAYTHDGPACSFDAFIVRHQLADTALADLATIVRGADTGAPELAPQAPGLLAISLGLSQMFADDQAMLRWGMLVYDSLYVWCSRARGEAHGWNPDALRTTVAPA